MAESFMVKGPQTVCPFGTSSFDSQADTLANSLLADAVSTGYSSVSVPKY